MRSLGRRDLLGGAMGALVTAALGTGIARCSSTSKERIVRIGVMSNLTHAPLIAGLGSGRIAHALAPIRVETSVFRSGPRVAEALIAGAIEIGTAGPAAIVIRHARRARNGRGGLRILAGCCSGGASLVVTRSSGITQASDLRGKRIAVPQIGTSQDVALRSFLRDAGLRDAASGGDVQVLAISGAAILDQMRRGDLHGAWLPEPWATRIVDERAAVRLIDERDLWKGRRFASAVLSCRTEDARDPRIALVARALEDEVTRAQSDPVAAVRLAHTELAKHVGNPGSLVTFERATSFVDFTSDPVRDSVERFGELAASLGLCPPRPLTGLFS